MMRARTAAFVIDGVRWWINERGAIRTVSGDVLKHPNVIQTLQTVHAIRLASEAKG